MYICWRISRFLLIKTVTIPFKYLGVFVGGKHVPLRYFDDILYKVKAKLSG